MGCYRRSQDRSVAYLLLLRHTMRSGRDVDHPQVRTDGTGLASEEEATTLHISYKDTDAAGHS
jgi:hypothetical protein